MFKHRIVSPPLLLIVSAPSGAGKTTLCARLLKDFPSLELSISCTTRAPRGSEVNGREYHFLSTERFEDKIKEGDFIEWAKVHGNYYGTSRSVIEEAFLKGKSVLLDIDVQGTASLKKAFPKKSFSVFVAPPSLEELEHRLRARGTDSEEVIQRRMANAAHEMAQAPEFDYKLVNQNLEESYQNLATLVRTLLENGNPSG